MGKILAAKLLTYFKRMLTEHWKYVWGSAQTGTVDCSGAFVWAYKQEGKSIYHGSNRIARTAVEELLPVSKARPGMAAFKLRPPDNSKYALPAEYKEKGSRYNGDLNDYYHIGLVGEDGKTVWNAQSSRTGFVASALTENWACVGYLNEVDYEEAEEQQGQDAGNSATVTAETGESVKMRKEPSASCRVWWRVPIGATVEVLETGGTWDKIKWDGKTGYMMNKFLIKG